ncbi:MULTISPECIES: hypothetical protein [unclassified Streptomyces]|uniref:hypothetical protein n=1 Tax=unclassified Streptomyces TaxID=2593676 RepID=UPI0004CAA264|nr:hypothetical protein [Streptomyces sp. NRRL F-2747]
MRDWLSMVDERLRAAKVTAVSVADLEYGGSTLGPGVDEAKAAQGRQKVRPAAGDKCHRGRSAVGRGCLLRSSWLARHGWR